MNKPIEMVVGAFGGATASVILEFLIAEAKIVLDFKYVSEDLATTMQDLRPILIKIESLQKADDLKSLEDTIAKARALVKKCSGVKKWQLHKKSYYTRKVCQIEKNIVSFCQVQLQILQHSNQLESMEEIKKLKHLDEEINSNHRIFDEKLDLLMEQMYNNHQIVINTLSSFSKEIDNNHRIVAGMLDLLIKVPDFRDLCSVPKLGKAPIGLKGPLMDLKKMLVDDSVSRILVSATPGCGKTKLVTQLCHDPTIKGNFKHIFFSVVSSTPNFRKLVQDLIEHNGYRAPITFENDSQAGVCLGILLERLKGKGILLVLDDVWSGAESLLDKFPIDIPDLKILVTSRYDLPGFISTYHLKPLKDDDARAFLIECASRPDHASEAEYKELLQEILKRCNGFPLVIKVLGGSLKNRTLTQWKAQVLKWSKGGTLLDTADVLNCLKPSFDALDSNLQDCFLDLGSFLEDQKIRASIIVDIWNELYDESSMTEKKKSIMSMSNLQDLANHNLLDLVPLGSKEPEDGFYNEFLVMQHDILRELAICQSESEAVLERKRLNLEIRDNNFPGWCLNLKKPISARLLSISTDDLFSSNWVEMEFPNVEALVLNISSLNYALPSFISTMTKLKVVIIINHGFYPARLSNFSCLSSLPNLKRIRLEKVSATFLDIIPLRCSSLKKLSLVMCSFGEVFYDAEEINVSKSLPSLQEIDIDYCYDLIELPFWVSEVVSLKILSITNCNKFSILPEAIGNLSKLEVLRLCSCINLSKLPETTSELNNLQFLDISDCQGLKKLPLEIGKLEKLKKISMRKCSRCELPDSVRNLENLEVTCDEETRTILWERLKPKMRNLSVYEEETEHNLNWLHHMF